MALAEELCWLLLVALLPAVLGVHGCACVAFASAGVDGLVEVPVVLDSGCALPVAGCAEDATGGAPGAGEAVAAGPGVGCVPGVISCTAAAFGGVLVAVPLLSPVLVDVSDPAVVPAEPADDPVEPPVAMPPETLRFAVRTKVSISDDSSGGAI